MYILTLSTDKDKCLILQLKKQNNCFEGGRKTIPSLIKKKKKNL